MFDCNASLSTQSRRDADVALDANRVWEVPAGVCVDILAKPHTYEDGEAFYLETRRVRDIGEDRAHHLRQRAAWLSAPASPLFSRI